MGAATFNRRILLALITVGLAVLGGVLYMDSLFKAPVTIAAKSSPFKPKETIPKTTSEFLRNSIVDGMSEKNFAISTSWNNLWKEWGRLYPEEGFNFLEEHTNQKWVRTAALLFFEGWSEMSPQSALTRLEQYQNENWFSQGYLGFLSGCSKVDFSTANKNFISNVSNKCDAHYARRALRILAERLYETEPTAAVLEQWLASTPQKEIEVGPSLVPGRGLESYSLSTAQNDVIVDLLLIKDPEAARVWIEGQTHIPASYNWIRQYAQYLKENSPEKREAWIMRLPWSDKQKASLLRDSSASYGFPLIGGANSEAAPKAKRN